MNKTEHDLLMSFDSEYAAKQEGIERIRKLLLKEMVDKYKSHHFLLYFIITLQVVITIMYPSIINVIAMSVNLSIHIVSPLLIFLSKFIHYRKKVLEL